MVASRQISAFPLAQKPLSKRTHLTGRGIVRLVRIARTIADVAESEQVTQDHVLEAAMYQGRRDQ